MSGPQALARGRELLGGVLVAPSILSADFGRLREQVAEVLAAGAEPRSYPAAGDEPSFTAAIRHIQAVLHGEEAPRQLATEVSLPSALALHDLAESAAAARLPSAPHQ